MAASLSAPRAGHTLPPGFFIFKDSLYSFLLEAESTPGPVRPEGLGQLKKNPPHRDLNPRPYGLQKWKKVANRAIKFNFRLHLAFTSTVLHRVPEGPFSLYKPWIIHGSPTLSKPAPLEI
jgi:hypothetical protein